MSTLYTVCIRFTFVCIYVCIYSLYCYVQQYKGLAIMQWMALKPPSQTDSHGYIFCITLFN